MAEKGYIPLDKVIEDSEDNEWNENDLKFLYKHTQFVEGVGNVVVLGKALEACNRVRAELSEPDLTA